MGIIEYILIVIAIIGLCGVCYTLGQMLGYEKGYKEGKEWQEFRDKNPDLGKPSDWDIG